MVLCKSSPWTNQRCNAFIDEPTQEGLNELRRAELMEVARLLEVPIRFSDRKAESKDTINQFFVKTDVWPASVLDDEAASDDDGVPISSVPSVSSSSDKERKKLEAQLKLKELELETRRVELKKKSLELKSKELNMRGGTIGTHSAKLDASKYAKLVPKVRENKVEAEKQRREKARTIAEAQKELDDVRWVVEHLKKVNAEIAAENKQEVEMCKRLEGQLKRAVRGAAKKRISLKSVSKVDSRSDMPCNTDKSNSVKTQVSEVVESVRVQSWSDKVVSGDMDSPFEVVGKDNQLHDGMPECPQVSHAEIKII